MIDINPPVVAGDRAFDLDTLLFYRYDHDDIRHLLRARLLDLAGPLAARAYLAHMVLRQALVPPFAGPFISGQGAGLELAPVMNARTCGRVCPGSAGAGQSDRWLSQSSAACATSRQPWSIVSEWPRSGNSRKSVMAGDLW